MTTHEIRPANMRRTHGLQFPSFPGGTMTVSAVACVEDALADPIQARESGAGMDAPEELPTGSVKAFFNGHDNARHCIGHCQRTTNRP